MKPIVRIIAVVFILFGSWLLLSGIYKPFLIGVGAVVSVATAFLLARFKLLDEETMPLELVGRSVSYSLWLLVEIIKAAWDVTKIILHPKLPISPTLVTFKPKQNTDMGRVIHANSITLTPGTITVGVSSLSNTLQVHGITREGALGCIDSEMDARVAVVEGETNSASIPTKTEGASS